MTLRSDSLAALAAFESAARHQNFAHAAEEMQRVAQPTRRAGRVAEGRKTIAVP